MGSLKHIQEVRQDQAAIQCHSSKRDSKEILQEKWTRL